MKKRYARAKPIKKESEEENKITKWDIVRTLISVVIQIWILYAGGFFK